MLFPQPASSTATWSSCTTCSLEHDVLLNYVWQSSLLLLTTMMKVARHCCCCCSFSIVSLFLFLMLCIFYERTHSSTFVSNSHMTIINSFSKSVEFYNFCENFLCIQTKCLLLWSQMLLWIRCVKYWCMYSNYIINVLTPHETTGCGCYSFLMEWWLSDVIGIST